MTQAVHRSTAEREAQPARDDLPSGADRPGWPLAGCFCAILRQHRVPVDHDFIRQAAALEANAAFSALSEHAKQLGLFLRPVSLEGCAAEDIPAGSLVQLAGGGWAIVERTGSHKLVVGSGDGQSATIGSADLAGARTAFLFFRLHQFASPAGRRTSLLLYLLRIANRFRPQVLQILLLSLLVQLVAIAVPLATGTIIDSVVPRGDWRLLAIICGSLLPTCLFFFLALYVRAHLLVAFRTTFDVRLSLDFLDHLLCLKFSDYQKWSTGDLSSRFDSHNQVRDNFAHYVIFAASDALLAIGYVAAMLVMNPAMGTAALLLAVVQVAALLIDDARRRELWTRKLQLQKECRTFEHEIVAGAETIKGMALSVTMMQRWTVLFTRLLNSMVERWHGDAGVQATLSTVRLAFPAVVLGIGAWQVLERGLSLGQMLAHAALCNWFLIPLSTCVNAALTIYQLHPHIARVQDVMATEREQDRSDPAPGAAAAGSSPRPLQRLTGQISARAVSLEMGGRTILDDISLDIRAGEFVALVGRSGSGKSTFVRVLLGLYRPRSGVVLYDGRPMDTLGLSSVRGQIGLVNQNFALFSMSVFDNIALGAPHATLADVRRAAEAAGIHQEIERLPHGYHTLISGEAGKSIFSGGQLQRLALARALARRPPVLILDEATSALDSVTEAEIHQKLDALSCTRIVIAHRLSSVRHADRIFVIRDGRIVETGTHAELLARQGEYACLAQAQDEPI